MITAFDLDRMKELLKDFHALTQLRIVVYNSDFQELCSYPDQRIPVCQMIRRNLQADEACMRCDREGCLAASQQTDPYIYTCHAGLTEAVSTLRVNGIIVGYLSFGQIFSYDSHDFGWKAIWELVARYNVQADALEQACRQLSLVSHAYILSAAHILDAVASSLVLQKMAVLQHDSIELQLDRYLTEHFSLPITVSGICNHFGIGKTTLYKLVRKNYGCGLADHIRKLRIEKAKKLLAEQPELSITEIADACGYSDYNYFIAAFSRIVGLPPRQYQKQLFSRGMM